MSCKELLGAQSTMHQKGLTGRASLALTVFLASILGVLWISEGIVVASSFTPMSWKQEVKEHAIIALKGQHKNQTWIRDKDHDFIDDRIETRFQLDEFVSVIVELNECLSPSSIEKLFSSYGKIKYIGKLITFVVLDDVRVKDLPLLSAQPNVAMIEWQHPIKPMNDIGSRSIRSRTSRTFSPKTAADRGFSGAGVNIAIVDTGVNTTHEAFAGKFVVGFDATTTILPNPLDDKWGHGTHVAGIALGKAIRGRQECRRPDDGTLGDCGGVAPAAGLVVVKVCHQSCTYEALARGLDWLGMNAKTYNVRVANISIGDMCKDDDDGDDGNSAIAHQVNYLVALGIAVSVLHGNAIPGDCKAGARLTPSPGSSSLAMTVQASDDNGTITDRDDSLYALHLRGPRSDFNLWTNRDPLALKPDLSAPGVDIYSADAYSTPSGYFPADGTSMAAPHVAGAAAVLIEALPGIDPGSLKDLLQRTANRKGSPTYPFTDPVWNTRFGTGIINIFRALVSPKVNDVGFPNCIGPSTVPGGPCNLNPPYPSWNNVLDIQTVDPYTRAPTYPREGVQILIRARVRNNGPEHARVLMNFGVYDFAAGNNQFWRIATQGLVIGPMGVVWVEQLWTPKSSDHHCIQVSIQYGFDTNFDNNVTQRNLNVAASLYKVRIENPFMVPAKFEIKPRSDREGWVCRVSDDSFALDPFNDCPRTIEVNFDPPVGAPPGDEANCDVAVYGTPNGADRPILIGGVTTRTFVPKPCRVVGQVVDKNNLPVSQAKLVFSRKFPGHLVSPDEERYRVMATTDEDGIFSVSIPIGVRYAIAAEKMTVGKGQVEERLECGTAKHRYLLSDEGLSTID